MKIMKFGGSSVKDAQKIKHVVDIVLTENKKEPVTLVLSAMKGITDSLISAAQLAEKGNRDYIAVINEIRARQETAITELFSAPSSTLTSNIDEMLNELKDILHGIELVRECSARSMDVVVSFGERLNNTLVAAYIASVGIAAEYIDARSIIRTDNSHGSAVVDFDITYERTAKRLNDSKGIPVVTGFIGSTANGATTTLGRNGSDYTASILGAAVGATCVEIWTDVDGVLSADPRCVKSAFVIDEISVQEAMELSYFGAEVIHPYTMVPVVERDIPIRIKNTLNPSVPGTLIAKNAKPHNEDITGIASIQNVALINVEGSGMVGIPGIASRIFSALARAKVNIIMISQASSEHSICFVFREGQGAAAIESLTEEFEYELATKQISKFDLMKGLEIVAIIGENMRGRPGISGKLFDALGKEKINVHVIAQGSSERNISCVVDRDKREVVLNTIHKAFFGK